MYGDARDLRLGGCIPDTYPREMDREAFSGGNAIGISGGGNCAH